MSNVHSPALATDRRLSPRLPALHPGRLFMPDGLGVDVVIVDLSSTGARVRLRRVVPTPPDLVLADRTTMTAHRARVAWTKDGELGLELTRHLSLKGVVPGPLQAAKAWCLNGAITGAEPAQVVHV